MNIIIVSLCEQSFLLFAISVISSYFLNIIFFSIKIHVV